MGGLATGLLLRAGLQFAARGADERITVLASRSSSRGGPGERERTGGQAGTELPTARHLTTTFTKKKKKTSRRDFTALAKVCSRGAAGSVLCCLKKTRAPKGKTFN